MTLTNRFMNQRTLLVGATTPIIAALSGCLGTNTEAWGLDGTLAGSAATVYQGPNWRC